MARHILALVATLGRNPSLMNRVTPVGVNHMYGVLQHRAYNSEALRPEVMASKNQVFHVRYLRQQVIMGLNGSRPRVARTSSRHQVGVIMRGMLSVCSRPFNHLLMEGSRLSGLPWTVACLER